METEITVQVFNSLEEIQNILEKQGYKMIENFQLNDWYFSKYDDISNFCYQELLNNSFLVRQIVDEKETIQLCYKSKSFDKFGNIILEEKTKTNVVDLDSTLKIFKLANLNNYCDLKNNSFVYEKNEICFAIQVIEDMGVFIEYEEDGTMQNMKCEEKINYMCKIVKSLGLNLGKDYSCKKVFMKLHNNL